MAGYRVKAPVVKVSVGPADGNRVARILKQGAFVPEGVEQDQLDALEARNLIEKASAGEPEPTPAGGTGDSSSSGSGPSIKDILAEVGDDKTKAAAVLDQEQARGDDARQTLVKKLQAIVDAS